MSSVPRRLRRQKNSVRFSRRSLPRTQRGPLQTSHLGLSAVRFNGPLEPRQIKSLPTTSQYLQASIVVANDVLKTVTVNDLTPNDLGARYRFERFSIYAPSVGVSGGNTFSVDGLFTVQDTSSQISFTDSGIAGASRAVVHYVPPLELRQTWYDSAATGGLFTISTSTTSGNYLVQFYCEVRVK